MTPRIEQVTERIKERSRATRTSYLDRVRRAAEDGPRRGDLSCSNLAHGFAACGTAEKADLRGGDKANVAIVSAYNDMLSAHQPLERFPEVIKQAVREAGGVAQFAGGVPAMCDGVTQGQPGMELSLFSRDVIAMSTAIALSHGMFDAALCLGVCDKIVPGLLIGALTFGHLPVIFVPGGPMTSGLPNDEKARIRQQFAEGKVGRDALLEAESQSYHGPGTCTFYGTANTNQMLMEIMGLHLPGASFVNPNTPLRDALTASAARRATEITILGNDFTPIAEVVDERAVVNGIVGLLATGGSTNHTIHLVAMARAAGIQTTWDDFADLSEIVPLLTRIYPNGSADVNHFQAAGGMAVLIGELLGAGLLHADVRTITGDGGLDRYRREPGFEGDQLVWRDGPTASLDQNILAPMAQPFDPEGGLKLLSGNLGRAIIKTSAVKPERRIVEAPAVVVHSQADFLAAFENGELHRDCVVVVRFQGPQANGMPELHKLTPALGVLQDLGYRVALVTDGRMSGASGKVPAAIHVTPEAVAGGPIARVRTGDLVRVDAVRGVLETKVGEAAWRKRRKARSDLSGNAFGMGRELFAGFRSTVSAAEEGATVFSGLPAA